MQVLMSGDLVAHQILGNADPDGGGAVKGDVWELRLPAVRVLRDGEFTGVQILVGLGGCRYWGWEGQFGGVDTGERLGTAGADSARAADAVGLSGCRCQGCRCQRGADASGVMGVQMLWG